MARHLARAQGISPVAISEVQMPEPRWPRVRRATLRFGGRGTLVTRYLGRAGRGEGNKTHIYKFFCNLKNNMGAHSSPAPPPPPPPPARKSLWPRGEDVEALELIEKSELYQGPCGLGKHNECLKYVCYHIILAKGLDSNSLFTSTSFMCLQLMWIIFLS